MIRIIFIRAYVRSFRNALLLSETIHFDHLALKTMQIYKFNFNHLWYLGIKIQIHILFPNNWNNWQLAA